MTLDVTHSFRDSSECLIKVKEQLTQKIPTISGLVNPLKSKDSSSKTHIRELPTVWSGSQNNFKIIIFNAGEAVGSLVSTTSQVVPCRGTAVS